MEDVIFFGTYDRKADDKNRLTIPSDFVRQIGKGKTVIASRVSVLNKDILAVFPNIQIFDSNIASYLGMTFDSNDSFLQRYVSNFSNSISIDNIGRISLRDMIVVPDDRIFTFVGRRDLFEIWGKNDYIDYLDSNSYKLRGL